MESYHNSLPAAERDSGFNSTDRQWLDQLAGRDVTDEDMRSLELAYEAGSKRLTDDIDPDTFNSVVAARQMLFESVLGWDDETHSLHKAYDAFCSIDPHTIPLDTFIETQRTCYELGLDAAKVVNTLPAAIGLNSNSLRAKVAVLEELGLDAAKITNNHPAAIGYNSDSVRAKMAALEELGLDAAKVVNTLPAAISLNSDSVRAKMAVLEELGLDAAKVVNTQPSVIGLNSDNLRVKTAALEELGLDAAKVVNTQPSVIGLNSDSVRAKMVVLEELGLDAAKITNNHPAAIGYNSDSLRIKFDLLRQYGYYSKNESFPGSQTTISRLMVLPGETLTLFLASHSDALPSIDRLGAGFDAFRKSHEKLHSGPGRKELYKNAYPELRQLVGSLAVRQARRNKIDTWSHLEGETIPEKSLFDVPADHARIV